MKNLLMVLLVASVLYLLMQKPEKKGCSCGGKCGGKNNKDEEKNTQRIGIVEQLPMDYENELPYTMPGCVLNGYDTRETRTLNSNMPEALFNMNAGW